MNTGVAGAGSVTQFAAVGAGGFGTFSVHLCGNAPSNFSLTKCLAVKIRDTTATSAVIVGSHDPAFVCDLQIAQQPGAPNGDNWVSVPYHTPAATMQGVCDDVGPNADFVATFDPSGLGAFAVYLCGNTVFDFAYDLGKAVRLNLVTADAPWVPSHF